MERYNASAPEIREINIKRYLDRIKLDEEFLCLTIYGNVKELEELFITPIDKEDFDREFKKILLTLKYIKGQLYTIIFFKEQLGTSDELVGLKKELEILTSIISSFEYGSNTKFLKNQDELNNLADTVTISYTGIKSKIDRIVRLLSKYPQSSLYDSLVNYVLTLYQECFLILDDWLNKYNASINGNGFDFTSVNMKYQNDLLAMITLLNSVYQGILNDKEDKKLKDRFEELNIWRECIPTSDVEFMAMYSLEQVEKPKKYTKDELLNTIISLERRLEVEKNFHYISGTIAYIGFLVALYYGIFNDFTKEPVKIGGSIALGFVLEYIRSFKERITIQEELEKTSSALVRKTTC